MTTSLKDAFKNQKGLVPAYLVFLNLHDRDSVDASITLVDEALKETPQLNSEVKSLFRSSDWRPHLVGAITCLLKRGSPERAAWDAEVRERYQKKLPAALTQLDKALFEAIESCPADKVAALMKLAYQRVGVIPNDGVNVNIGMTPQEARDIQDKLVSEHGLTVITWRNPHGGGGPSSPNT